MFFSKTFGKTIKLRFECTLEKQILPFLLSYVCYFPSWENHPFVYFRSLSFHAEQVAYSRLVWSYLLKINSNTFVSLTFSHMDWKTKQAESSKYVWSCCCVTVEYSNNLLLSEILLMAVNPVITHGRTLILKGKKLLLEVMVGGL